jgi:hypothetical protein
VNNAQITSDVKNYFLFTKCMPIIKQIKLQITIFSPNFSNDKIRNLAITKTEADATQYQYFVTMRGYCHRHSKLI